MKALKNEWDHWMGSLAILFHLFEKMSHIDSACLRAVLDRTVLASSSGANSIELVLSLPIHEWQFKDE